MTQLSDLLVIEATAPAGGVAVLGDGLTDLPVQLVAHVPRHALPGHDEDDDDSVFTAMASAVAHQTQDLLCLVGPADDLRTDGQVNICL